MAVSLRLLPFLLTLAACVGSPFRADEPRTDLAFSPIAFFAGDTVGEGLLKIGPTRIRTVHVVGHGDMDANGALTLVQRVREGYKPERTRTWHIRPLGGDRYTGTLSDAAGPVSVTAERNALRITYVAKGGFGVEQRLFLQPGGQVALNQLVVRKLGVRIARLRETITRQ